jgi:hypothetical protein
MLVVGHVAGLCVLGFVGARGVTLVINGTLSLKKAKKGSLIFPGEPQSAADGDTFHGRYFNITNIEGLA